jgi:probable HAF family extracellular repeat protein
MALASALKDFTMNRYSVLLTCFLIASASAATADSRYQVVDLGIGADAYGINDSGQVLVYLSNAATIEFGIWDSGNVTPLHNSFAFGINARGQAVGAYYGQFQFPQAFLSDRGTLTPLGAPAGATGSQALAINNRGRVVGWFIDSSAVQHPFQWEKGVFTALPQGLPGNSVAYAVNDGGTVVGSIPGNGGEQPATWQRGQLTQIGVPPDLPSFVGGFAFGVNNRGDVLLRAASWFYVWRKGVFTKLGDYPFGLAYAINDSGDIACTHYLSFSERHGCVWHDGEVIDLPTLGGLDSVPRAINNSGDLAGFSLDANGVGHAVIWVRH